MIIILRARVCGLLLLLVVTGTFAALALPLVVARYRPTRRCCGGSAVRAKDGRLWVSRGARTMPPPRAPFSGVAREVLFLPLLSLWLTHLPPGRRMKARCLFSRYGFLKQLLMSN